jgi:hypothetical protein
MAPVVRAAWVRTPEAVHIYWGTLGGAIAPAQVVWTHVKKIWKVFFKACVHRQTWSFTYKYECLRNVFLLQAQNVKRILLSSCLTVSLSGVWYFLHLSRCYVWSPCFLLEYEWGKMPELFKCTHIVSEVSIRNVFFQKKARGSQVCVSRRARCFSFQLLWPSGTPFNSFVRLLWC